MIFTTVEIDFYHHRIFFFHSGNSINQMEIQRCRVYTRALNVDTEHIQGLNVCAQFSVEGSGLCFRLGPLCLRML